MASPRWAAGTHWLMIMSRIPARLLRAEARYSAGRYCRSSSSRSNWSNCAQKSNATSGAGRGGRSRAAPRTEQRPGKVLPAQAVEGGVLRFDDRLLERGVAEHRVHHLRHLAGILGSVEHAAAVHRRRDRRGRIGHDRHPLVERLDQRHAEPLVLAGAQEQIGDVVERRQLLVRHVAEEMDVRCAEPGDQRGEQLEVALEAAVGADQQQPRSWIVPCPVDVERADHVLELLVRDDPAHEHHVGPLVVEPAASARSGTTSRWTKSGTTGSTPVAGKPSASSSSRLYSESPSASSQRST